MQLQRELHRLNNQLHFDKLQGELANNRHINNLLLHRSSPCTGLDDCSDNTPFSKSCRPIRPLMDGHAISIYFINPGLPPPRFLSWCNYFAITLLTIFGFGSLRNRTSATLPFSVQYSRTHAYRGWFSVGEDQLNLMWPCN